MMPGAGLVRHAIVGAANRAGDCQRRTSSALMWPSRYGAGPCSCSHEVSLSRMALRDASRVAAVAAWRSNRCEISCGRTMVPVRRSLSAWMTADSRSSTVTGWVDRQLATRVPESSLRQPRCTAIVAPRAGGGGSTRADAHLGVQPAGGAGNGQPGADDLGISGQPAVGLDGDVDPLRVAVEAARSHPHGDSAGAALLGAGHLRPAGWVIPRQHEHVAVAAGGIGHQGRCA